MLYLSRFTFPDDGEEFDFLLTIKRKCYDSFYPFKVLSARGVRELDLEPVTVLYGGNGSGKTTALNVMAETLKLRRDSRYNRSNFFEDYTTLCVSEIRTEIPKRSRVITSDDVFDFMLNLRAANAGVDEKREELFQEYLDAKYSDEPVPQQHPVPVRAQAADGQSAGAFQWRKRFSVFHPAYRGGRSVPAG